MTRKSLVAIILIFTLGLLTFIFWPDADETRKINLRSGADDIPLAPPGLPFESLAKLEPQEEIIVELAAEGPRWLTDSGELLLQGPTIIDRPWEWTTHTLQEWTLARGTYQSQDLELRAHLWTSPNLGMALIDLEATISADELASPLDVLTLVPSTTATILTAELSTKPSTELSPQEVILASRFDDATLPVHLFTPAKAAGRLVKGPDPQTTTIAWEPWPKLDSLAPCPTLNDEQDRRRRTSKLRLIIQFGPQPLAIAAPTPSTAQALATPVFVDPPRLSNNAWADGRAQDALELSRRIRALSFGHSNSDDPRYGNGGLLANHLGASFAIPTDWWDDEPIQRLRQDLKDTTVELIPHLTQGPRLDDSPSAALLSDEPCLDLRPPQDEPHLPPQLVLNRHQTAPFTIPIAADLPPRLTIGKTSSERSRILNHLFHIGNNDGLFAHQSYRLLAIPLIATRNPLEPMAEQALLSPERNGHWTLHDSLTRELSTWELESKADTLHAMSLNQFLDHRATHSRAFAIITPHKGDLEYRPAEHPVHFLIFDAAGEVYRWNQTSERPLKNPDVLPLNLDFRRQ